MPDLQTNVLYYGDNLGILRNRDYFPDDSVDLIYLDPPFNSKADYNVLFKEPTGELSAAQIKVFSDTWHWDTVAQRSYEELVSQGPDQVASMISSLRDFIRPNDMMAYLVMMTIRLLEMRRVLKPHGSIYLHCDPKASHYLKVVMDTVFGKQNFRNEIVWRRTGSHNLINRFGPIHEVLLFYTKSDSYAFSTVYRPYTKGHVETYFKKSDKKKGRYWTNALTGAGIRKGDSGKPWRGWDPTSRGRHWAIPGRIADELGVSKLRLLQKLEVMYRAGYVQLPSAGSSALPTYTQYLADSPGLPAQDIWAYQPHTQGALHDSDEGIDEDVRWLTPTESQRLGYQTQKPLGLLGRIIQASSGEGDVVLDPFCGCGTAVVAAHELNRRWVGIDITYLAITVMKRRLEDSFGILSGKDYEVVGEPVDLAGAHALAEQDRDQFQWWAIGLVGAKPAGGERKKGADKGIDGVINFVEEGGKAHRVIVSVKSGQVGVAQVRDLRGTLEREKADLGLFITLQRPTEPMRTEAVNAAHYQSAWTQAYYPKIQICTIEELLEGRLPKLPHWSYAGFTKAGRIKKSEGRQEAFL